MLSISQELALRASVTWLFIHSLHKLATYYIARVWAFEFFVLFLAGKNLQLKGILAPGLNLHPQQWPWSPNHWTSEREVPRV